MSLYMGQTKIPDVRIGSGGGPQTAVLYTPQELTAEQQLQAKENIGAGDYVTPEMFGARGDGVTDDSAAIQAALDTGSPVCLSRKTYLISTQINVPANTNMFGSNNQESIIAVGAGIDGLVLDNVKYVKISDIAVVADGGSFVAHGQSLSGIVLKNAHFVVLDSIVSRFHSEAALKMRENTYIVWVYNSIFSYSKYGVDAYSDGAKIGNDMLNFYSCAYYHNDLSGLRLTGVYSTFIGGYMQENANAIELVISNSVPRYISFWGMDIEFNLVNVLKISNDGRSKTNLGEINNIKIAGGDIDSHGLSGAVLALNCAYASKVPIYLNDIFIESTIASAQGISSDGNIYTIVGRFPKTMKKNIPVNVDVITGFDGELVDKVPINLDECRGLLRFDGSISKPYITLNTENSLSIKLKGKLNSIELSSSKPFDASCRAFAIQINTGERKELLKIAGSSVNSVKFQAGYAVNEITIYQNKGENRIDGIVWSGYKVFD